MTSTILIFILKVIQYTDLLFKNFYNFSMARWIQWDHRFQILLQFLLIQLHLLEFLIIQFLLNNNQLYLDKIIKHILHFFQNNHSIYIKISPCYRIFHLL